MIIGNPRSSDPRDCSSSVPSGPQRLRFRALLLLGGLAACAPTACVSSDSDGDNLTDGDTSGSDDFEQYAPQIVGGTKTTAYPSTGYVEVTGGSCTGTLIGKQAVLTAAHCVDKGNGQFYSTGSFWTQDANGSWTQRPFSQTRVHPGYTGASWQDNDIAVLILDSTVSTIAPSPLGTATPYVGRPFTIVGYGYTSFAGGNDASDKYFGTNTIASFVSYRFNYEGSTAGHANNCAGDSGGPSFDKTGAVIGVTSTGVGNQYCSTSGTDVRVDPHINWILAQIPASGGGSVSKCATVAEGGSTTLSCSGGRTIAKLTFASYGNPTGSCGAFSQGSCNAATSTQKLDTLCKGKASCTVAASNATFGDPCSGITKNLRVQYTCQ